MAIGWSSVATSGGTTLHSNGLVQAEESGPDTFLARIELDDPEAVIGALERAERFYFKESANLQIGRASRPLPSSFSFLYNLLCPDYHPFIIHT